MVDHHHDTAADAHHGEQHHSHQHAHGGGHGHKHTHASGRDSAHPEGSGDQHKGKSNDEWSGDEYLKYPGLREVAEFSHLTVLYAMKEAGMSDEDVKALNVLEVGCGAGAVTKLYAESFATVHAIDVSASMLATFSEQLPSEQYPHVTHSQHTLSAASAKEFASGEEVLSPTKADAERKARLPRAQWDLAVVNLVLHHVDDIEGFGKGLKDLIAPGGMVVFTEFTNLQNHRKETQIGSVNAPHHYHKEFNEKTIAKLLGHYGFTDIYTEVRGKMNIWREGEFHAVDCLIARAKKGSQ